MHIIIGYRGAVIYAYGVCNDFTRRAKQFNISLICSKVKKKIFDVVSNTLLKRALDS